MKIESQSKAEGVGLEQEITLTIGSPVSFQNKGEKLTELGKRICDDIVRNDHKFFTGDVEIHIEWEIHQGNRYLTNQTADIDNIIKPVLDALSGPDGVLINDCQVMRVTSEWRNWDVANDDATVTVSALTGSKLNRADICFVRIPVKENFYVAFARSALKDAKSCQLLIDQLGVLAPLINSRKTDGFHERDCRIFCFSRIRQFGSACRIELNDASHPYPQLMLGSHKS